jgi:hypothetical protein
MKGEQNTHELRVSLKRNGTSLILHTSLSSVDDSDEESDPAAEDTSSHDDVASSSSGSIKRFQILACKEDRSEVDDDCKSPSAGADMLRRCNETVRKPQWKRFE